MTDKNKKSLIISTLVLIFGIVVIALYCIKPTDNLSEAEKYRINFDSSGGSAIAAITIEEGESLNIPTAPTKEGYIFVGWTLNGEPYDFSEEIEGDMTLVAVWKEVEPDKVYYTVTFETSGGTSIANQIVEENNQAIRPSTNPTKEGYTFIGWTVNGEEYDFNAPVTSDVVITATWEQDEEPEQPEQPSQPGTPSEPEVKTYTVRFNANGGSLVSGCGNQTVKSGETAKNTCTATRSGYTLVGFNTSSSATTALNITTRKITANTTYYAIWRQNPTVVEPPKVVTYNISFNPNGGTLGSNCPSLGSGKIVNENSALSSACTVTRPHYQFVNWTAPNGKTTTTAIAAGTYTANWQMNTFKVGCDPLGDYITQITCSLYITENGQRISGATIKINGKAATTINIPSVWDKITSVTFDYDGLTDITATK